MTELEKVKNKNLTVPNLISAFRIVLIIPFVLFFMSENYIFAFATIVLSGISDALDGLIARKFNQISSLGKILDPIADKLTLVVIIICVGILIPGIVPLVIVLVIKDLLMLLGGSYLIKKKITPPAAMWFGKMATIIFYISVTFIVLGKSFFRFENYIVTMVLLIITTAAMLFALINYTIIFVKLLKENKGK